MADLKLAKPDKKDFDIVYRFNSVIESLGGKWWDSLREWENWSEDDEDYKILSAIKKDLMSDEDLEEDELEENHYKIIAWEYVKWVFQFHPSALGRVILCATAAMDNAFDNRPEVDTIEWKPEIDEAITLYKEHKETKSKESNEGN